MAGDVVNLRQARKRRQRAEQERVAEQNRISHGRSGQEKRLTDAQNAIERRRHEAGRIEIPRSGDDHDGQ